MNPTPNIDSEQAYMESMYTDEEKQKIRQEIETAAGSRLSGRVTTTDAFKARKRGILFPILVNVCAVVLIVGGWFGADAWFKTRQQTLRLQTDQLFSAEGTLLSKILQESKAQLEAKNQEIQQIKNQLSNREAALKAQLAKDLANERLKLQGQGLSATDIEKRLAEFSAQKNAQFNKTLETFQKQAQLQITEAAKKATQQAEALDRLAHERDELNLFHRQSDALFRQIHESLGQGNYAAVQNDLDSLKALYYQADRSGIAAVRERADAQKVEAATLQNALDLLRLGGIDPRFEAFKADLAKAQKLSAGVERSALVTKAVDKVPEIARALAILQAWQTEQELARVQNDLAEARALATTRGPKAALEMLHSSVSPVALRSGIDAAWLAYQNEIAKDQASLDALKKATNLKQLDELQKSVADLLPYKTRWESLAQLYAQNKKAAFDALLNPTKPNYDEAKKDFLVTFASENAQALFPDFDKAIQAFGAPTSTGVPALPALIAPTSDATLIRNKAFDDVLLATTYLGGHSPDAKADQEKAGLLSLQDAKYRDVISSIQALLHQGAVESPVNTNTTDFWGALVSLDGTSAVIEPLTRATAKVGQTIEVRHRRGTADPVVARGTISVVASDMATAQITPIDNAPFQPISGDAVYLVRN